MRHPRVRRPFIVESRGSNRDSGSVAIPKRIQPGPQAQNKPAAQAAPFFDPWAAITAPVEPSAAPRRILPNIMPPDEPAPAEAESPAPAPEETRLPRVRRVKLRASRAATVVAPQAVEPPPPPPMPVVSRPEPALTLTSRPPLRTERSDRSSLPAGQRWKARLPRSCW